MTYTKDFVAKEINWAKKDIEEAMSKAPVQVKDRLEKVLSKLSNVQELIKHIT